MKNPPSKLRVFLLVSAAVVLMFLLAGGCLVLFVSGPAPAGSADDDDDSGREHYTLSQHLTRLKIAGQFIWYDTLDALSRTFGGKSGSAADPTEEHVEPPGGPDDSAVSELSRRSH
jgi:hypothetical protein